MLNDKGPSRLRFGPFELNPETREFRKHGVKVRMNGQTFKLLLCLLNEPGSIVSREELRNSLWPDGTFVDFDHSLNAAVNRLRERLGDSFENSHYIETLPGSGYRFIALVEPVRLPGAPVDTHSLEAEELAPLLAVPAKVNETKRLKYVAAAAAALAAALFLLFAASSRNDATTQSIALLPLQNDSHDPEQEYLADGMTDQLITEMGRFRELKVISRTSTEQFRHITKPLSTIARELRVKYLVEGAVARSANRVRVNVRLVQSDSGRQVWAESYDGDLSDALLLQGNVARAVAQEIDRKLTLTTAVKERGAQTIPAPAWEAYLKGKYVQARGTKEALYRSIGYFEQAIEAAPNFAGAYAALSGSYCSLSTNYASPQEVMPKARRAAEEALRLDGTSAEAHSLLGRIAALYDWNWAAAEQHLQRAVELNPSSAVAHVNRATFLIARGRVPEALAETRKAHELDPASLQNEVDLDANLFDANQLNLLEEYVTRALQFDPAFPVGHTLLGWTQGHKGMLADGIAHASRGVREGGSPGQVTVLGVLEVMAGQRTAANKLLSDLRNRRTKEYVCAHEIAGLEAALGLIDEAMHSLELAYREHSDCMPFLHSEPTMNPLRSDPRFQALLRRIEQ